MPRTPTGPWRDSDPLLSIGCGLLRIDGWTHLDAFPECCPDMLHDLNEPPMPHPLKPDEPCPDNYWGYVWACNVLEHLRPAHDGLIPCMQELWRTMKPGAILEAWVPTFPAPNAWQSVTHRIMFHHRWYEWFCMTRERVKNPYWEGFRGQFEAVSAKGRGKHQLDIGSQVLIGHDPQIVLLRAVKTDEEAART